MCPDLPPQSPQLLSNFASNLEHLFITHKLAHPIGQLTEVTTSGFRVEGLSRFVSIGYLVRLMVEPEDILAEVIRIDLKSILVRPLKSETEVRLGTKVVPAGHFKIRPSQSWKGRMIDPLGHPVDRLGSLSYGAQEMSVLNAPPDAMHRAIVKTPVKTGIKIIDIFTPICAGQRIGIFSGSGVGKTTTLSMLGISEGFTTVVTVLVGERGREVREFAESPLGQDHARCITVVSTSNDSAMMRKLAPLTGMKIAEYFRDQGESVLLIVDSITRYAQACREIALAAGEAPVARGFPPSVFTLLPQLLERAGPGIEGSGSITGVFSVLVDGDDHNDPVADVIRGTLDGHIVLKRSIAEQGRYPAVDPLASISRLAHHVWTADQNKLVQLLRAMIARFEDSRDLRAMGGYIHGADVELDRAILLVPKLYQAMSQSKASADKKDVFHQLAEMLSQASGIGNA